MSATTPQVYSDLCEILQVFYIWSENLHVFRIVSSQIIFISYLILTALLHLA